MNAITDAGKRFASTADLNVGDVNPNAPVGSTVALIEQGLKHLVQYIKDYIILKDKNLNY